MAAGGCLLLAACSANPTKTAKVGSDSGVAASPRVVAEGEAVPKGGGKRHVGKPYQIAGRTYTPTDNPEGYRAEGLASWYGAAFHGRKTSNGEIFDKASITAAHPTMPLPSYARVTNKNNGRSIIVRVNDRGPFHRGRVIDVSRRAAEALAFRDRGVAKVAVEYVGPAALEGSDDDRLMATLSIDGNPAKMDLGSSGTMLAAAEPAATATGRAALESATGAEAATMRSSLAAESKPAVPATKLAAAQPMPMPAPALDSAGMAELSSGATGDVATGGDAGGATPSATADARVAAGFAAIGEPMPLKPTISAGNQSQMLVAPTLGSMALSGWR